MPGLFDDGIPEDLRRALTALENADADFGVPYPFNEKQDLALLRRVAEKYPALNLPEMVEKFVAWCTDATPWLTEKGKPATIRWRSRIWTWAANESRYRNKPQIRKGRTHYAAQQGHTDQTEVLERW